MGRGVSAVAVEMVGTSANRVNSGGVWMLRPRRPVPWVCVDAATIGSGGTPPFGITVGEAAAVPAGRLFPTGGTTVRARCVLSRHDHRLSAQISTAFRIQITSHATSGCEHAFHSLTPATVGLGVCAATASIAIATTICARLQPAAAHTREQRHTPSSRRCRTPRGAPRARAGGASRPARGRKTRACAAAAASARPGRPRGRARAARARVPPGAPGAARSGAGTPRAGAGSPGGGARRAARATGARA
jgi:hypothetical protein